MTSEDTIAAAEQEAVELAVKAAPEELLAGAVDREAGPDVLADLLAHELAASHRLMQRIAAAGDDLLNWSEDVNGPDEESGAPAGDSATADLAAARLAGVAGRLMEQVRLGLVALRRLRPDLPDDEEGLWFALRFGDDRCSDEEYARRLAEAKAAKTDNDPPLPKTPRLSARAQARRAMAMEAAAQLAAEAGVAGLAVAATAEGSGAGFLLRLFTYELGAIHDLTMRLAGCADRAFDRAVASEEDPAVALQLSAATARLGDRFRRGLLTLRQLGGDPDRPRKVAGYVWAGPEPAPAVTGSTPANDASAAPAAAPAASFSAGHGVNRSDSLVQFPAGGAATTCGESSTSRRRRASSGRR
jgi:hypothetical protein